MEPFTRRSFLKQTGALAGSMVLSATFGGLGSAADEKNTSKEVDLTPLEDLMHEHGLLNRLLLIYEDCQRRILGHQDMPIEVVKETAGIVRSFIEDYHEKNEEQYIFPRFEKANVLVDLVHTLRTQHAAGRVVTAAILESANHWPDSAAGDRLVQSMQAFITMYRPHEAREDTVLFPAFKALVSPHEYNALGERFEDIETAKFGKHGFEHVLAHVETLEKTLGIYDLAQFTPKVSG